MTTPVIAVHGGCGVMARDALSASEWADARRDLARALRSGWAVLDARGRALDAVEAAVVILEDSPHFNAGHGAALNTEGEAELDAAIMDGATLAAGSVCAARAVRNPVRAARAVLETGSLVMLAGAGADRFAAEKGLPMVDAHHFVTERQRMRLAGMKERRESGTVLRATEAEKHGTVGAVALDAAGHLAAATSTGGFTDKPVGRIGDSPVIGAGTYARDGVVAVSGTGQGEYFIRHVLAHDLACRMAYRGETLAEAAADVLEALAPYGIGAGLVAVDATGTIAAPFNTRGMFRGWIGGDGVVRVGTHGEIMPAEFGP